MKGDSLLRSLWCLVESDVPQGSVLGPLFYAIFINDLSSVLKYCKYLLYADDLQIYIHGKVSELPELFRKIDVDILAVRQWSTVNKLFFNARKTKVVILGSPYKINLVMRHPLTQIRIVAVDIDIVDNAKNLGVIIDSTLSWDKQVSLISKRVYHVLRQLRHSRSMLSMGLRKQLVMSLFIPIFDYCCLVMTNLTQTEENRLRVALNTCIRFIFNLRRSVRINPYYKRLGWLEVPVRRKYFLGSLTYKIISERTPSYLAENFIMRELQVHCDIWRPFQELVVPPWNREIFHHSFIVSAAIFWNGLPSVIKRSINLRDFKTKLYDYLLEQ